MKCVLYKELKNMSTADLLEIVEAADKVVDQAADFTRKLHIGDRLPEDNGGGLLAAYWDKRLKPEKEWEA